MAYRVFLNERIDASFPSFLHFYFCLPQPSSSHRLNKLCELYAKVLGSQEALQVRLLPFPSISIRYLALTSRG